MSGEESLIPYDFDLEGYSFAEDVEEEESEKPFSYFDLLDAPRYLPEPVDLTLDHLKDIAYELGLIKLCWPEIIDPYFEERTSFPKSYVENSDKEKVLLVYTENFRRQFSHKYPNRKPLFLACENECGMQKMVCTTIRPTTLPFPELETWEECARCVADLVRYELFEDYPTLLNVSQVTEMTLECDVLAIVRKNISNNV
ncbi:unnamed protein product [Acanthoscelides obtectus]|uniref:Uncharacterized protein n=1 Tax=Acanthoscelides obtectus TaxID=200917 RepID=A0A9P0JK24_ACAOB|nr:unnamed protein product [Acanthoscelides obtectus]CAK1658053.1 Coiled-coil domain-containing protein lobo [Acanthoscelides obtectus]